MDVLPIWYKMINRYFKMGFYTTEEVKEFVLGSKITEKQYKEITGVDYTV